MKEMNQDSAHVDMGTDILDAEELHRQIEMGGHHV